MSKTADFPAFPLGPYGPYDHINEGMLLRDWFAGMALQNVAGRNASSESIAIECYELADAMLIEREIGKNLNKGLIIYGETGKSATAKEHFLRANNPMLVSAKRLNPAVLAKRVPAGTDLVIIEECPAGFDYELFCNAITNGIEIDEAGQKITITPKFIFVSQEIDQPVLVGASLRRRFSFYSTDLGF